MKNMKVNKIKTINLTTTLIIGLFCGSFQINAAVPIKFEVGGSRYYKDVPCIVKVAFKYHNDDLAPLISSPITEDSEEKVVEIAKEISQERSLIEHADVYILRVGENKNIDAISNSTRVPVNALPADMNGIRIWFEKDDKGQQKILRARVELKDDQPKQGLQEGESNELK